MNIREVDVAAKVAAWLRRRKLEVYQEVEHRCGVIDLVGVDSDGCAEIVEVKTRWTWELMDQALTRTPYANRVWAAAPGMPPPAARRLAIGDCLGLLAIMELGEPRNTGYEMGPLPDDIQPWYHLGIYRNPAAPLLRPEPVKPFWHHDQQNKVAAGQPGAAGRSTRWSRRMDVYMQILRSTGKAMSLSDIVGAAWSGTSPDGRGSSRAADIRSLQNNLETIGRKYGLMMTSEGLVLS